jgi:hypothetical protein
VVLAVVKFWIYYIPFGLVDWWRRRRC